MAHQQGDPVVPLGERRGPGRGWWRGFRRRARRTVRRAAAPAGRAAACGPGPRAASRRRTASRRVAVRCPAGRLRRAPQRSRALVVGGVRAGRARRCGRRSGARTGFRTGTGSRPVAAPAAAAAGRCRRGSMLPLWASRKPAMRSSRVDLPEPLAPLMAVTSPGCGDQGEVVGAVGAGIGEGQVAQREHRRAFRTVWAAATKAAMVSDQHQRRDGGGVVGAIGAEGAVHQQRQGREILGAEQRDDAEIAEREAEAEGERRRRRRGRSAAIRRRGTAPAAKAERADQLAAAARRWRRAAGASVARAKGSESRALAMSTTNGAAAAGRGRDCARGGRRRARAPRPGRRDRHRPVRRAVAR